MGGGCDLAVLPLEDGIIQQLDRGTQQCVFSVGVPVHAHLSHTDPDHGATGSGGDGILKADDPVQVRFAGHGKRPAELSARLVIVIRVRR